MSDVHPPDIASAHAIAEAAIAGMTIDDMLAAGMGEKPHPAHVAMRQALAIRATNAAELRFRLTVLADTLLHEQASDHALALLDAALADLDGLALAIPAMSGPVEPHPITS